MMRLEAPMMFTGFAALSVDTQKYSSGGNAVSKSRRRLAWRTLFWSRASTL